MPVFTVLQSVIAVSLLTLKLIIIIAEMILDLGLQLLVSVYPKSASDHISVYHIV